MDFVEDQVSLAVNGMDPPVNPLHVIRALDLNHPTLACDLDNLNRPGVIRIATTASHTFVLDDFLTVLVTVCLDG